MALYLDASLRRTALPDVATPRTYIRSREFDSTLLLAPIFAGSAAALAVTADPRLYPFLLVADLWLLGYHHVVATYTRLAFDTQSLRRNRVLAVDLLVGVTLVTLGAGVDRRRVGDGVRVPLPAVVPLHAAGLRHRAHVLPRHARGADAWRARPGRRPGHLLVPIYAIAQRSSTMGDKFLGMPVKTLVLPRRDRDRCSASPRPRPWSRGSCRIGLARSERDARPALHGLHRLAHRDLSGRIRLRSPT